MHAEDGEWDYAHTDYNTYAVRPAPAGLVGSESCWRHYLENQTPLGWLLRGNTVLKNLASGKPIYLMHTTKALDAIRSSGQLYAAAGCLVGALYCAPLTREASGLRPHNLGSWLLETKRGAKILVFEISPGAPVPALGIDYLRLGGIHLRTYLDHTSFLTSAEDAGLRRAALQRVRASAGFLDVLLANACGARTSAAEFLGQLAATVPAFPFLGYLYFEVLSEYLMLHSTAPETKACADAGELNNRLYKRLAFLAVPSMGQLFDLAQFSPDHDRLLNLIGQIEPALAAGAAEYIRRRLPHLFACVALDPAQDAATVTFQHADFASLTTTAPRLLGQAVFRELRTSFRYPQLFPVIEQVKALQACGYWNRHAIPTPFNGTIPKGEIGINLAYPAGGRQVWLAETCDRGLLHPVEQLDLTFVPRLTDLRATALGRTAFPLTPHPQPAVAAT